MNPIARETLEHENIARRFPFVPRGRPPCHPLDIRIRQVCQLADTSARHPEKALTGAAEACNLAALIASDCGLAALAADLCWTQSGIFAHGRPFDSGTAKLALQPLINLGRLHARDGRGTAAYHMILALFDTVAHQAAAEIGGRTVDLSGLTRTREDYRETLRWLWTVLLSDGTRALTQDGHWDEALRLVETHHGIGDRLLDGRQIAIIARHTAGDHESALRLLSTASAPTKWEQAVATVLAILTGGTDTAPMVDRFLALDPAPPAQVVFRVRLGLTVIDLAGTDTPAAPRLARAIETDVLQTKDAYAARDASSHPAFSAISTQREALTELLATSGLKQGAIPSPLLKQLSTAITTAKESLADALRSRCSSSPSPSPLPLAP